MRDGSTASQRNVAEASKARLDVSSASFRHSGPFQPAELSGHTLSHASVTNCQYPRDRMRSRERVSAPLERAKSSQVQLRASSPICDLRHTLGKERQLAGSLQVITYTILGFLTINISSASFTYSGPELSGHTLSHASATNCQYPRDGMRSRAQVSAPLERAKSSQVQLRASSPNLRPSTHSRERQLAGSLKVIAYTILVVPYCKYSIISPKTLF